MKNIFLKLSAFVLFLGLAAGCEEDKVIYDGSPALTGFTKNYSILNTFEGTTKTAKIEVSVTSLSSVDREIIYEIDPASSANVNQYQIVKAIIPANSYFGTIEVSANYDLLPADKSIVNLIFNLKDFGGASVIEDQSIFTLDIKRSCPIDFAAIASATFSGTTSYQGQVRYNGFDPVLVQSTTNPNEFTFESLWGQDFVGTFYNVSEIYGKFVYPGKLIINEEDYSVTVEANTVEYDPTLGASISYSPNGASGFYDPCTNVFTFKVSKDFSSIGDTEDPSIVDVVLTAN